jgi:four helix bundle protein
MGADFVDLVVWRESAELAAEILGASKLVRGRARSNTVDQMIRAAESIPANIVEGVGRGVSRDCLRFLTIARASAQELEQHLRQALISSRLHPAEAEPLISHTRRVRFLLRRFQESVQRRLDPPH